jgi:AraC-like DNA-binding protein
MSEFIHISSIAELYGFLNTDKPSHPLITIIRKWPKSDRKLDQIKFTSDLYFISLKRDVKGSFKYGRNSYDYQEGSLVFIKPGQVATFSPSDEETESNGWTILFHPDLIRKFELGKNIHKFSFFNYESNEALHLSDKEKLFLNNIVDNLELEIYQNLDIHSQDLIVQNLEIILKYSNRYYDRQFFTRTNLNKEIVVRFENYLQDYFSSDKINRKGIPSITDCGKALNMSGSYLSNLLRIETSKSAKEYIYEYLIERAKYALLNSNNSISQVAFQFGFDYPQNFSKLFKSKTGMSPTQYRNHN